MELVHYITAATLGMAIAYLAIINGYLASLAIGAILWWRRGGSSSVPLEIAVVIPAHNEELQIATCVQELFASDYPAEKFSIFVVADNCTDATADNARSAGATAFGRCDTALRGKGQALDWFIRSNRAIVSEFDVIAVVDADTKVDRHFLREISADFGDSELLAVQGFHGVSNPETNWRTSLTFAGFALINGLRPAGRSFWGGTGDLKGNGMAFRSDLLLRYGWPAHSIVEDIEFSVRLLLDGVRVRFNPRAVVLSEMPAGREQAEPQRRRWESGRIQTIRTFVPRLLGAFARTGKWQYLDAVLELLVPPLSLLVILEVLAIAGGLLLYPRLGVTALVCACCTVLYVAAGLYLGKAPLRVWLSLLATPLFLVWKIPFYVRLLFTSKPSAWERTRRQAEIDRNRGA